MFKVTLENGVMIARAALHGGPDFTDEAILKEGAGVLCHHCRERVDYIIRGHFEYWCEACGSGFETSTLWLDKAKPEQSVVGQREKG